VLLVAQEPRSQIKLHSAINAAAGDQTKGETSALGVKFTMWHQKLGMMHLRIKQLSVLSILVHPKIKKMSFTHSNVVPNL